MNCWQVLEIEATQDTRSIKKAYTRLLRRFPPETDSQGFQNLRSAYEHALMISRFQLTASGEVDLGIAVTGEAPRDDGAKLPSRESDLANPLAEPPETADKVLPLTPEIMQSLNLLLSPPGYQDLEAQDLKAVEELMARIEKDFPENDLRQSEEYWKSLTELDLNWNLAAKAYFGFRLIQFFGAKNLEFQDKYFDVHIPDNSWKTMDKTFGWLEDERDLYARLPENQADAAFDRIRAAYGLRTAADLRPDRRAVQDLLVDRHKTDWSAIGRIGGLVPMVILFLHVVRSCTE